MLASRSAKNFNQRTMEHYINKHKREDRSPEAIEYEKNASELTFHPKTISSRPMIEPIREPANMQRNHYSYN